MAQKTSFLLILCCVVLLVQATDKQGLLSIPPSLYWDGVDGSWSTFTIELGTPGQAVRLLPGTSANAGNSIWVVLPQGCTEINSAVPNCLNERGYAFTSNKSSTWNISTLANGGLFQLDTYEESFLGLSGNAYYGFDTVQLGTDGSGLPLLKNQLVAGFASDDFWLGSLGLSPIPFNFTDFNQPVPSLLRNLRDQKTIASTSWAYTAGAFYANPPVFGSLTLGGWDNARFDQSTAIDAIPFGADFSRDLLIGIQSITYNTLGSSPLLSQGIYAFIDSMVTSMYLPVSVCEAFEQAFNLTWNATAGLYLLSSDQRRNLLAQDPTFTFALGPQANSGGSSTDINIPYSAFDLNISQPYVAEESYYFPLRRAENSSQYTLGRVFLQEAYVIADYDRRQFRIAQALFPSAGSSQRLQVLHPPGHSLGLGAGAIAGIAIGAISLLAIGACTYLWIRRKRKRIIAIEPAGEPLTNDRKDAAEKKPFCSEDVAKSHVRDSAISEVDGRPYLPPEMPNNENRRQELEGHVPVAEVEGHLAVYELEAGQDKRV